MARIRTLKPEALLHRKVGRLSDRAFRLWVTMILQADDAGRLVADAGQLKAVAFGFQERTRIRDVEASLQEICLTGLIRLYQSGAVQYADFPSWRDHQRIDKPYPSKLPPYEQSQNVPGMVGERSENVLAGSEGKGSEGKGSEGIEEGGSERQKPSPPPRTLHGGNGLDPKLSTLLSECPQLLLVASPESAEFWDRIFGACDDAKASDAWLSGKIRQWDQWFASHPSRRSRDRRKLEARLMGWLGKDLERLARMPT